MAVRSHKLHCELSEHGSHSRDLGPQTALGQVGAMECAEAEEREAGNLGTCARVHMPMYERLWRVPDNRRSLSR